MFGGSSLVDLAVMVLYYPVPLLLVEFDDVKPKNGGGLAEESKGRRDEKRQKGCHMTYDAALQIGLASVGLGRALCHHKWVG